MSNKPIYLCVPMDGKLSDHTGESITRLETQRGVDYFPFRNQRTIPYEQHMPAVRNVCVEHFMSRPNYDYMLFLDSDISIPPDGLEKLLSLNVPVAAGACGIVLRGRPVWNYALLVNGEIGITRKLPEKPLLVDGCGAGCLLIKREVFEAIERPWFQWEYKQWRGEDFSFTAKCRDAGLDVVVHPGVVCGHWKTVNISSLLGSKNENTNNQRINQRTL